MNEKELESGLSGSLAEAMDRATKSLETKPQKLLRIFSEQLRHCEGNIDALNKQKREIIERIEQERVSLGALEKAIRSLKDAE